MLVLGTQTGQNKRFALSGKEGLPYASALKGELPYASVLKGELPKQSAVFSLRKEESPQGAFPTIITPLTANANYTGNGRKITGIAKT